MITAKNLRTFSESSGVPTSTIDKDWVLGRFLTGIFQEPYFQENLVFKGGTCLKKCYFGDYRFSEDLDFTAVDVRKKEILSGLEKSMQKIYSAAGILFGKIRIEDKTYKDNLTAYECSIPFWGADHPGNKKPPSEDRWQTSVKIDFTLHEVICLPKEMKKIIHPYPDICPDTLVPCYPLEEIIAEKFRALLQRNYSAPRDYYDLWHILTRAADKINQEEMAKAFYKKCDHKKIQFHSIEDFFVESKLFSCKREWDNSLHHHLKLVPPFDMVIKNLRSHITDRKIFAGS